jgi:hypothetical protein
VDAANLTQLRAEVIQGTNDIMESKLSNGSISSNLQNQIIIEKKSLRRQAVLVRDDHDLRLSTIEKLILVGVFAFSAFVSMSVIWSVVEALR